MFRRNFDFIAVLLVLAGMAMIQEVPRLSYRVQAGGIQYQDAIVARQCALANRVLARVRIRRAE
jgi:hypothetical protein